MSDHLFSSNWIVLFFTIYFIALYLLYFILSLLGGINILKRRSVIQAQPNPPYTRPLPEITVIVAAYNEENSIIQVTENLLSLTYPLKQIIVVNDGSTDQTLPLLKQKYELVEIFPVYQSKLPTKPIKSIYNSTIAPELLIVDKENGKKFDALNTALNVCHTQYFITVDADTFLDDRYFESLIDPILNSKDAVAIGASVHIINGCQLNINDISTKNFPPSLIIGCQANEYMRSFLWRQGWDALKGIYFLAGAFSIFLKDAVIKAGGFAPTVADDLEVILRLNRLQRATQTPYHMLHLPDPTAWTEAPATAKELGNQRKSWYRGFLESLWFHKSLLFNPNYGRFGLFVYPYLLFGEAIESMIEALAYIYVVVAFLVGDSSYLTVLFLLLGAWGFTSIMTLTSLALEEYTFKKYSHKKPLLYLIALSILENFGYRQWMILCKVRGLIDFFKKFNLIQKNSRSINELVDKAQKKEKFV